MYIGRPAPLGNVAAGSMPIVRYSVEVTGLVRERGAGRQSCHETIVDLLPQQHGEHLGARESLVQRPTNRL